MWMWRLRREFCGRTGTQWLRKSTFAKHINGILIPTEGTVWVSEMDTADDDLLWEVRKTAGMVFQNPDNQIIGNVVEEDVGFGPENIAVLPRRFGNGWIRAFRLLG